VDQIQHIPLAELSDHPHNPRLSIRQDVVDSLVANLADGFDPAHALIVRPWNGQYQILSGHHRKEAAKQAGLTEVPCWVRELDDDEAYMMLATCNAQGELSPLEIGLHALHCVELGAGGRGKKGGMRGYAERVGKDEKTIRRAKDGAEVALKCGHVSAFLHDKTAHLAAIHALPQTLWKGAVETMLHKGWSAQETGDQVRQANQVAHSTHKRIQAVLQGITSPGNLEKIDKLIVHVGQSLSVDPELAAQWHEWASSVDPLDMREVQQKRLHFEEILLQGEEEKNKPVVECADWREWIERQPLGDLLLTDPPYMTDVEDIAAFAQWLPVALARVKSTGRAFVFIGAYPEELQAYLNLAMPTQVLVWTYRNTLGPQPKHDYIRNLQFILYYRMPDAGPLDCPLLMEQISVQDFNHPARSIERFHEWQKPDELAEQLIRHSTKPGDLVLDPFCCTGTFPLAAAHLGRVGRGGDNSADHLHIAEQRGCRWERDYG